MPPLAFRTTIIGSDNPEVAQRFSDAIREGHPVATAAIIAGISERTARRYLAEGEAQAGDEGGSPCLFWQMFKDAEAAFVESQLQNIHRDADTKGGWAASMTLLERRRPADFGRNQRIEIDSHHTETHRIELGEATLAVLERIAEMQSIANPHVPNKLLPESTDST